MRCPKVTFPEFKFAMLNFIISLSYKARIHLMGRANLISQPAQVICLLKVKLSIVPFSISGRISTAFPPFSIILFPRYKPLPSISISSRSETFIFKLLAKPSAALVGLPSLSNAAFRRGPVTVFILDF
ncbi:hypothetical protein ES703_123554 [subsurface metagenome]